MGRKLAACTGVVCLAAIACNALTGAADLEVAAAIDGGPASDARAPVPDASPAPTSDTSGPVIEPPKGCPAPGRSCAGAPPADWAGPYLVYQGAPGTVPPCPPEMPDTRDENAGTPAGTPTCACGCETPTGSSCVADLVEYDGPTCATLAGTENLTFCRTNGSVVGSVRTTTTATGGSCVPKLKPVTNFVSWSVAVRLCKAPALLADGCAAGELCTPDGVTPFRQHTCIVNDADGAECPAPWTDKLVAYKNVVDDRACTVNGCSCGAPTDVVCTGMMKNFTASTGCFGASEILDIPFSTCKTTAAGTSQKLVAGSLAPKDGTCPPVGFPTTTGGVSPGADTVTICCQP